MTDHLRAHEIDDDEGRRLVRIVRRGTGSVVTWRRAQMVLLPAQGMDASAIAEVAFTSEDRVRVACAHSDALMSIRNRSLEAYFPPAGIAAWRCNKSWASPAAIHPPTMFTEVSPQVREFRFRSCSKGVSRRLHEE